MLLLHITGTGKNQGIQFPLLPYSLSHPLLPYSGKNQGIQFPIAESYAQLEAAALMVEKAATLYDAGLPCGEQANMAKLLAADASWKAADVCTPETAPRIAHQLTSTAYSTHTTHELP